MTAAVTICAPLSAHCASTIKPQSYDSDSPLTELFALSPSSIGENHGSLLPD
jgi:hypothetical protein